MPDVNRYPTWVLLVAAVAMTVAVVVRFIILDRGASPRRIWPRLLAVFLATVALAGSGLLKTRTGQRVTANEGLLVDTDILAGLLVLTFPARYAVRRLPDADPGRLRPGADVAPLYQRRQFLGAMVVLATTVVLLAGEIALAAQLPALPAAAACQDYRTWILAPANATLPPEADVGTLARASTAVPPGRLRDDLRTLLSGVRAAILAKGTEQGILDEAQIVTGVTALNRDCAAVPATG